jgi:hypothetical protein
MLELDVERRGYTCRFTWVGVMGTVVKLVFSVKDDSTGAEVFSKPIELDVLNKHEFIYLEAPENFWINDANVGQHSHTLRY